MQDQMTVDEVNKLKFYGKWALTVCFSALLMVVIFREYKQAHLKKLNYFMPRSYQYIREAVSGDEEFNEARFKGYEHYYKILVRQMPNKADAYGMLGFVSYYLGKRDVAINSYKKAIGLNPSFLWFYYNLGAIYLKEGHYKEAIAFFQMALKTDPKLSMAFILSSGRIYMPVIAKSMVSEKNGLMGHLKAGYGKAYYYLALSFKALAKNEKSADALQGMTGLEDMSQTNLPVEGEEAIRRLRLEAF